MSSQDAAVRDGNRPYAPPSNFITVLRRLRSRNLPEKIDAEYLRDAGIPGGTVSRTLFALRFIGLVDDDIPTSALRSIAVSTDEEYKATLAALVKEAYADVFNVVDLAEDPQERILNVFRRYKPASQRERMVIFFLGLCREAGITTMDSPRSRAVGNAPKNVVSRSAKTSARPTTQPRKDNTSPAKPFAMAPALEGLIRSLPPEGTRLTKERRKQWLAMAEATLSFIYPEGDGSGMSEANDKELAD